MIWVLIRKVIIWLNCNFNHSFYWTEVYFKIVATASFFFPDLLWRNAVIFSLCFLFYLNFSFNMLLLNYNFFLFSNSINHLGRSFFFSLLSLFIYSRLSIASLLISIWFLGLSSTLIVRRICRVSLQSSSSFFKLNTFYIYLLHFSKFASCLFNVSNHIFWEAYSISQTNC